jgi:flagellar hook protein FlgE
MPSFSIALTGLEANSVALNSIGNNLANLNTTAFKEQTTSFADLFYQNIGNTGSNDALQVGLGTRVAGTDSDYSQGSLATTTNSTDMALSGNGFFVVNHDGVQSLTRAGNFQLDNTGNLITTGGESVMGYGATSGVISPGATLTALSVPVGQTEPAQATQNFGLTGNLDASATVGTTFSSSITMYDSLGNSHAATVSFTNAAPNTWNYSIQLPPGDATGVPANNTGTLTFNSSGTLVSPSGNLAGIKFPGLADGASDMSFNWSLYSAGGSPLIGQSVAPSAITTSNQDGFPSGAYQSFTVDSSGVVAAQFSNGQTENVGQVAVASVTNLEGLTLAGGNDYQTTVSSGSASIGVAGTGGRGTIEDDSLEQSNVDISTEFANLIVAQRAFEANSKTVTTFDTVTDETINMIR